MPTWTTHTEGGSWHGGGTEVRDCSDSQQKVITSAFDSFINAACLDCFPGLRDCLRRKWNGEGGSWYGGGTDPIEIDCTDPDCSTLDGRQSGNKVLICNTSSARVGPVLLHELTHACGGKELDSEAVEFACFNRNGDTLPFGDDWDKFRDETDALDGNDKERVGQFVIWNSDTGEVWAKNEEGGGWGGPKIAKGARCFQSDSWKHTYADGGGWL